MLFAMNKTFEKTSASSVSDCAVEPDGIDTAPGLPLVERQLSEQSDLTAAELLTINDQKLTAIRRAIQKGDYDSDAILEKALDRMLERLEKSENEQ